MIEIITLPRSKEAWIELSKKKKKKNKCEQSTTHGHNPIMASIIGQTPIVNQFISKKSKDQCLPISKIAIATMEIHRRQGLCYYCVDKFTPGRKSKEFAFIVWGRG